MQMPYYGQPYSQPLPQYQPQFQQPNYQPPGLSGRIVNDFSEITIRDIPTDGSIAYFIKSDGSEIQGRKWSENGSVLPVYYTRCEENPQKSVEDTLNDRISLLEERLEKIEKTKSRKAGAADE